DQVKGIAEVADTSDLVIVGTSAHHVIYDVLFGSLPDKLIERLDTTVLLTHSGEARRHTFLRALFDRLVY
ncbi:MAG: hypothetical protein ABEI52_12770, partial [Halobacteriaceae archaeon]